MFALLIGANLVNIEIGGWGRRQTARLRMSVIFANTGKQFCAALFRTRVYTLKSHASCAKASASPWHPRYNNNLTMFNDYCLFLCDACARTRVRA